MTLNEAMQKVQQQAQARIAARKLDTNRVPGTTARDYLGCNVRPIPMVRK